ncbi:MAG TPA: polysaccharide biosynthesis tyrosine autokinase [Pyrinomonadaceae bacterium]|nr:polysaccharide biosynthesis tyrosine autokinase [Pyrinomonadaceae bacterium]
MKDSREIIKQTTETVEIEKPFEPQIVPNTGRYQAYREVYAQDGFQFIDYWRAIRKRLWLVIGIAVLITTLTAIYMARKPDIFMAVGTVQVDLEQANPDLVTDSRRLPNAPDPSYFNTQLQLLTSESLLRRVVKEYSLDSNKEFQSAKNEGSTSPFRAMLKAVGLAGDDKKKDEKTSAETSNTNLATSEEIAEAIRLAPYVDILRKNLGIDPIREARTTFKDTRLISVSYRHTNPQLASFIVNAIIETFSKFNQEKRSGTQRKTNDFLSDRIADLQGQIKADENRLVALKKEVGRVETDDAGQTIVTERLTGLNKQLLDAENNRKNAEAQYKAVANSPERQKAMTEDQMARYITERENDIRTNINDIQKKIAELEAQKRKLLEDYQPGAFEVQEVESQIKSLQTSIDNITKKNNEDLADFRNRTTKVLLESLKTKYISSQQAEDKIRAAFNEQYNMAQGQSQGAVSIKLLEQNITTNRGFLENLQKQVSENDVIAKGTDNNISVAEISIPPDTPVSPRRLTTVLAALFLSTLFGMGLALFLEYLDDTIRSTEEIENLLQLPALAAIPTIDSMPKRRLLLVGDKQNESDDDNKSAKSELLIHKDSRSALAEAYRQLRTSILLSTAGHAPKSLLITSSLPSEGKTTTATNTAISLAQTGAKVLIIDADMRRPRLHSVFEISNAEGLSSILSSELSEKEMLDVVQYDEASKLHLLPSGPVPPNPAELIGSEQMSNFLKKMQNNFTHVVVDSPPIASFTDGVLIASMVDGVILVVNAGKSSKQVIRRSKQLLSEIGAKIFGVVLNNVNLRSQDNYYYYQSYYHSNNYRHDDE